MSSPSAPNLHIGVQLQSAIQTQSNDTFTSGLRPKIQLDQSSSLFSLSQDPSISLPSAYGLQNNLKLVAKRSFLQKDLSLAKDRSPSNLIVVNTDNSLKQSSFLSQLQELDSQLEHDDSNQAGDKSLLEKFETLIYEPQLKTDLPKHYLQSSNDIQLNGRIATNMSQSYIEFDPQPVCKPNIEEELLRLKEENAQLKNQLASHKYIAHSKNELLTQTIIDQASRGTREQAQKDIVQGINQIRDVLERQGAAIQSNQGLDTSTISYCSNDIESSSDEEVENILLQKIQIREPLKEIKIQNTENKQKKKQNELLARVKVLENQLEEQKSKSKSNPLMTYASWKEGAVYEIYKRSINHGSHQLMKSSGLRRTKTLTNIGLPFLRDQNIFDESNFEKEIKEVIEKFQKMMVIPENVEENWNIEQSTAASNDGQQSYR